VGNRATDVRVGKIARKSGLPDLRIIDADLGQARDQCTRLPTWMDLATRFCPPYDDSL
jgi:hypothetical protein